MRPPSGAAFHRSPCMTALSATADSPRPRAIRRPGYRKRIEHDGSGAGQTFGCGGLPHFMEGFVEIVHGARRLLDLDGQPDPLPGPRVEPDSCCPRSQDDTAKSQVKCCQTYRDITMTHDRRERFTVHGGFLRRVTSDRRKRMIHPLGQRPSRAEPATPRHPGRSTKAEARSAGQRAPGR